MDLSGNNRSFNPGQASYHKTKKASSGNKGQEALLGGEGKSGSVVKEKSIGVNWEFKVWRFLSG